MNKKALVVFVMLLFWTWGALMARSAESDKTAGNCLTCHKEKTPGLYQQWLNSAHSVNGITCIDCHNAKKGDSDAFMHYDALIATLVTPKDCGQCHEQEMQEVDRSHHAKAGLILESADAYLANAAAGSPAAIQGCESCHGCSVKIDPNSNNKLSLKSWPNSGIGRLNPDGSKGACNACHTRHNFSKAQARQPEACGKCHLGPDHPQKEIYEESKHGNTYYTNIDQMNLKSDKWVVGEDYFVAPTCSTCHLSATSSQIATHDVGNRIAWTLRPKISVKLENWEKKRLNMKDVCRTCHGSVFVNGHFYQYDASVHLYNEKFAKPAGDVMQIVLKNNLLKNKAEFGNQLEWTYWELWHHEGRRARHGASMMGPDYTWWHGFYDVAQHFYFKFIPEARELDNPEVNAYLDKLLKDDPMHQWLKQPTDRLKQMIKNGELQKIYHSLFEKK
ncbi:MAG: hydroxylamine dehydrogenase [Acidobacteriota bacterium]|nr:hydroxylamine dehydrogenase [Acidobacteriota bacterium]